MWVSNTIKCAIGAALCSSLSVAGAHSILFLWDSQWVGSEAYAMDTFDGINIDSTIAPPTDSDAITLADALIELMNHRSLGIITLIGIENTQDAQSRSDSFASTSDLLPADDVIFDHTITQVATPHDPSYNIGNLVLASENTSEIQAYERMPGTTYSTTFDNHNVREDSILVGQLVR